MILAGDIGGTKARLGLFKRAGGRVDLVTTGDYVSKEFPNLSDIIANFLDTNKALITQEIEAACFGLPGPVINGRVKVTNLPWEVVQTDIGLQIGVFKTKLVNDLVSTAAAIPTLETDNLEIVYDGGGATDQAGSCAVVAPGTGIGHSLLHREAGWSVLLASEAGHINFAPTNELEIELLRFLQKRLNHVSVESLLCGPGLVNIYTFLVEGAGYDPSETLREPSASLIAAEALSGESATAVKALNVFCEILGAHCSNIALTYLSTGGIYLGGGIPPKIAPFILDGSFLRGYLNKGKLKERVLATPVYIIRDDRAALFGAAAIAATL